MNPIKGLPLLAYCLLIAVAAQSQTYFVKDSNANSTIKDYKVSRFGIKSNGLTLNTSSIQKAIDFISINGGGRLVFYVGRYLTGSLYLRSNVIIHLEEGAVLVAPESIYNYSVGVEVPALITARAVNNTGITGKGVIEGNGKALLKNIDTQLNKGFITNQKVPPLVLIDSAENILLTVQNYIDVPEDAIRISNSSKVSIDSAAIRTIPQAKLEGGTVKITNAGKINMSNVFFDAPPPFISLAGTKEVALLNVLTAEGNSLGVEHNRLTVGKVQSRFLPAMKK